MEVKQRTRKPSIGEMSFKRVSELIDLGNEMIVTNRLSGGFPDMLLGIQIRRSRRKPKDLNTRMLLQKRFDQFSTMPSGAIPEQQNRLCGISGQEHK